MSDGDGSGMEGRRSTVAWQAVTRDGCESASNSAYIIYRTCSFADSDANQAANTGTRSSPGPLSSVSVYCVTL